MIPEDQRREVRIYNPIGGLYGVFPVTDKCERSCTLMGDDQVKIVFDLEERHIFEAFSFIIFDGCHFFLREKYRPTPRGSKYEYTMTFVSTANMLAKSLFMRYYQVAGETIQPEPEVNINANLYDMSEILLRAIQGASARIPLFSSQQTIYSQLLDEFDIDYEDMVGGTELKSFSFESNNIVEVLNTLASEYKTEWWVEEYYDDEQDAYFLTLHFCKLESLLSPVIVSDTVKYEDGKQVPYTSRGILSCEYANEWSNIPQRILPFGSDRNIVREQRFLDQLPDKDVYVSYGKRLRLLHSEHTYTVGKRKTTNKIRLQQALSVRVENPLVTSGIEKTRRYTKTSTRRGTMS